MKAHYDFLRGADLLRALGSMKSPVKWLCGGRAFHVPPDMAACIARASTYEGKYRNGRVHFIREYDARPAPVFDPSFRDGRAVVQPFGLDKRVVALWDRFFASQASPR